MMQNNLLSKYTNRNFIPAACYLSSFQQISKRLVLSVFQGKFYTPCKKNGLFKDKSPLFIIPLLVTPLLSS